MIIGVPKEIKNNEYRVGLTPASARDLIKNGHEVIVERGAGVAVDFTDSQYTDAGAKIVGSADEIFSRSKFIIKVKEPQPKECKMLGEGQILFTYLHLAPDPKQTQLLIESGATCIAYETVTDNLGGLPLLAPMSEVAGRMSVQAGASHLEKTKGGRGVLLSGVPGVPPATVVIIGGGVVGENAALIAVGMGADVTIIERSVQRLRYLDARFQGKATCVMSNDDAIEKYVLRADLVVGAVLIPGAKAPRLVDQNLVKKMKYGSVLVDVAIDQGGCFETSKPTTHDEPTYKVNDVVHYCVANMPGSVPLTSSEALNNATLPHVLSLAEHGVAALDRDRHLANGLNVRGGEVTYDAVLDAMQDAAA